MNVDNDKLLYEANSKGKKIYPERNVKVADIGDIIDQIKVSQVSTDDAKKVVKGICGLDDINNKIILLRIKYNDIKKEEFEMAMQSLKAATEILFKHNSTFVFSPDTDSIAGVTIEDIDSTIKVLEKLKEKINNENNSDAGDQAGQV